MEVNEVENNNKKIRNITDTNASLKGIFKIKNKIMSFNKNWKIKPNACFLKKKVSKTGKSLGSQAKKKEKIYKLQMSEIREAIL